MYTGIWELVQRNAIAIKDISLRMVIYPVGATIRALMPSDKLAKEKLLYRRLMFMILVVSIGSQHIFLVVVGMAWDSLVRMHWLHMRPGLLLLL